MTTRHSIRFIFGDELREIAALDPLTSILDWLRLSERMTGTKEGCSEGDCGACTVVIGRLVDNELRYEAVNACIRFLPTLDGCHLLTVEHVRRADGSLHPVQQALVDKHASQCGFCTPGMVMSLYALWLNEAAPDRARIETALQGNLCRCTGYRPIVDAGLAMGSGLSEAGGREREDMTARLRALNDAKTVALTLGDRHYFAPATLEELARLHDAHPGATLVAGATDVGLWVTKAMRHLPTVISLGNVHEMQRIDETDEGLRIGAGVTYTRAWPTLARHYPAFDTLLRRLGGEQVRNQGTIGGNIANGSPIGDMPPALIALGASVHLRRGRERRSMALEDFFIAYGKQAREPGEFVEAVTAPYPGRGDVFRIYKISKRRDEDISTLCAAILVTRGEDGVIAQARIACGGMAGTPKRAAKAEAALIRKPWKADSFIAAAQAMRADFTPLSDWRASSDYRTKTAGNLLLRFFEDVSQQSGAAADAPWSLADA